jgi:hypothetical protein
VVNNESLGVVRSDAYASPSAEKICRGNMKAAVERGCTKDSVLISDDLNYIKVGQIDSSTIQTFPMISHHAAANAAIDASSLALLLVFLVACSFLACSILAPSHRARCPIHSFPFSLSLATGKPLRAILHRSSTLNPKP